MKKPGLDDIDSIRHDFPKGSAPPRWIQRLLLWFHPEDTLEEVTGDLEELYAYRYQHSGKFKTNLLYLFNVLSVLPPFVRKRTKRKSYYVPSILHHAMLRNYFKIAWRKLLDQRVTTLINLFGLALGMGAFWLILDYVSYELSYDKFHQNKSSLYRVHYQQFKEGVLEVDNASAVPAVGPAMKANFPEVVNFTRITTMNSPIISFQSESFREQNVLVVDPSFLQLFTFPLIKGSPGTALTNPNSVVLTESTARKYFGTNDPIGKTLMLNGERSLEVRAVCHDVPLNSHIKFDFLISSNASYGDKKEKAGWYWYDFYTYILLVPQTDPVSFEAKFNQWVTQTRGKELEDEKLRQIFTMQSVTDLHLYSHRMQELVSNDQGNGQAVYFLLLIGCLILAIAWINYINLTTAHSIERAKEVGVRQAIGAYASQLRMQILIESLLLNGVSALIAVGLIKLLSPWFSQLTGHTILIFKPVSIVIGFTTILVGSFLAGFYPAWQLSKFRPVTVLKGVTPSLTGGIHIRQMLIVFQFGISLILIVGTMTIYRQLSHLQNKNLGVNLDQTLIVNTPGILKADSLIPTLQAFKSELLKLSSVSQVTISSSVPGQEIGWMNTITPVKSNSISGENAQNNKAIFIIGVDQDYAPFYQIDFLAGRNFSSLLHLDQDALLLNSAATRLLGFANPQQAIGQRVNFRGKDRSILGVLADYNHVSPKKVVDPIVFTYQPATKGYISLKINSADYSQAIQTIKQVYQLVFPTNPFDYHFLNVAFNQQYKVDLQFKMLISVFASLSIVLACLGLLGLITFITNQRTKEIGVRKVLGASVTNIALLLSKDLLKLVLFAILIASPIAWYLMNSWLLNFAYKIDVPWWMFAGSGLLVVGIALFTVSFQSIKAALMNPVKSLKNE